MGKTDTSDDHVGVSRLRIFKFIFPDQYAGAIQLVT